MTEVWQLTYQQQDDDNTLETTTTHADRDEAIRLLVNYLIDGGVTVMTDPSAVERANMSRDYRAEFTTDDGTRIRYSIRPVKQALQYLSVTEVAERIGVAPSTLSRYKLPTPDALIGTTRGWLPGTIDAWNAARPGRGTRTDLHD